LIGGEMDPMVPPPGYALAQDLKKRSLTEKISQLCWFCPVMSELYLNQKDPDYYQLSSQVLLHSKVGS